jgi:hypothetical protein
MAVQHRLRPTAITINAGRQPAYDPTFKQAGNMVKYFG